MLVVTQTITDQHEIQEYAELACAQEQNRHQRELLELKAEIRRLHQIIHQKDLEVLRLQQEVLKCSGIIAPSQSADVILHPHFENYAPHILIYMRLT